MFFLFFVYILLLKHLPKFLFVTYMYENNQITHLFFECVRFYINKQKERSKEIIELSFDTD